ncbi:hypothetical protein C8Q70DRAFT_1059066 [Cubamyces menziesii]|nr:hypothetical protein C8Q70DRAFT_1059066 [Cubamyces menziesii]
MNVSRVHPQLSLPDLVLSGLLFHGSRFPATWLLSSILCFRHSFPALSVSTNASVPWRTTSGSPGTHAIAKFTWAPDSSRCSFRDACKFWPVQPSLSAAVGPALSVRTIPLLTELATCARVAHVLARRFWGVVLPASVVCRNPQVLSFSGIPTSGTICLFHLPSVPLTYPDSRIRPPSPDFNSIRSVDMVEPVATY